MDMLNKGDRVWEVGEERLWRCATAEWVGITAAPGVSMSGTRGGDSVDVYE